MKSEYKLNLWQDSKYIKVEDMIDLLGIAKRELIPIEKKIR